MEWNLNFVLFVIQLSTSEMTSIVSQNPSLETLAIDVPDFEDVHASAHELRDELKKVNKRFCKVVKLPVSAAYIY